MTDIIAPNCRFCNKPSDYYTSAHDKKRNTYKCLTCNVYYRLRWSDIEPYYYVITSKHNNWFYDFKVDLQNKIWQLRVLGGELLGEGKFEAQPPDINPLNFPKKLSLMLL